MSKDLVLSPSGINKYLSCPYSFKLRYIDGFKPVISDDSAIKMGKSVHLVLEKFYGNVDIKTDIPEIQFVEAMKKTAQEHWDRTIDAKKRNEMNIHMFLWLQFEIQRFKKYKSSNLLERFCPVTTEEDITDWEKKIRAIIDKRCIGMNGLQYALDYKTDKNLPALRNFKVNLRDIDNKYKVQSAMNAMVLNSQGIKIDNFYFQFIRYPDKLLQVPLTSELFKEVEVLIKSVREATEYPKNHKSCFYCDMKLHCKTESSSIYCVNETII
jgi:CRISPR/Cas system-associated exonuclease Cas4 (RecB family)